MTAADFVGSTALPSGKSAPRTNSGAGAVTGPAAPTNEITAEAARELTDRIKVGVEGVWLLVKAAYESRAWSVLGYPSWDDYCTREFGASRIRLPREDRSEVVASLREAGLSLRAIEAATGVSRKTVISDLRERDVVESPPPARHQSSEAQEDEAKVTGTDGKTYPTRAMERLRDAAEKHPITPPPFRSREAIDARVARAKEMAEAGSTSRQIAAEIGITPESMAAWRERHGIDVPADRVVGRGSRIDPNRVMQATADAAIALTAGADLYDFAALDRNRLDEWADSLSDAIRFLTTLRNRLKKESAQ